MELDKGEVRGTLRIASYGKEFYENADERRISEFLFTVVNYILILIYV